MRVFSTFFMLLAITSTSEAKSYLQENNFKESKMELRDVEELAQPLIDTLNVFPTDIGKWQIKGDDRCSVSIGIRGPGAPVLSFSVSSQKGFADFYYSRPYYYAGYSDFIVSKETVVNTTMLTVSDMESNFKLTTINGKLSRIEVNEKSRRNAVCELSQSN